MFSIMFEVLAKTSGREPQPLIGITQRNSLTRMSDADVPALRPSRFRARLPTQNLLLEWDMFTKSYNLIIRYMYHNIMKGYVSFLFQTSMSSMSVLKIGSKFDACDRSVRARRSVLTTPGFLRS